MPITEDQAEQMTTLALVNMVNALEESLAARTGELQNMDVELSHTMATLTTRNADLANVRRQVEMAREAHRHDIDTISKALTEEARARDWCSEYDRFLEKVNRDLNIDLAPRPRKYRVTTRITLDIDHYVLTDDEEGLDVEAGFDKRDVQECLKWIDPSGVTREINGEPDDDSGYPGVSLDVIELKTDVYPL
jgi:hypothetical protein